MTTTSSTTFWLLGGVGIVGLGLVALAMQSPAEAPKRVPFRPLQESPVDVETFTAGAVPLDGVPGVWAKPGVVLNSSMLVFIALYRQRIPSHIPLVLTSGKRTEERQARALKTKRELGDDLLALYRRGKGPEIVRSLLAVPNTVAAMAAVLKTWTAQGVYMSRHMRGDALDFRTRGLPKGVIHYMANQAQALGARAVIESAPPHLHVEAIKGAAA